ncbi:recombinase family protein [Virgibacillus proomii]|jgi:DNA invertase Pin-like site-specific DNA recombinase|uniref:recombinase family protein n=1 Tax=Virgibacillus proomii TaxID=84407 RepID=UPI001FE97D8E|nr:recombinase family protein [Virgibacillus proomii]
MLKEKDVAVFFEDEKINTLTMDSELLLVVLSFVAQQEVENISANVKKGLKMKMKRGELIGFQGALVTIITRRIKLSLKMKKKRRQYDIYSRGMLKEQEVE